MTDTLPPVSAARAKVTADRGPPGRPERAARRQLPPPTGSQMPMRYTRKPPMTPVLREEHRYCQRDSIVKPPRAHHCRMCGTVSIALYRFSTPIVNIHAVRFAL